MEGDEIEGEREMTVEFTVKTKESALISTISHPSLSLSLSH
jgi:hypothetical protein